MITAAVAPLEMQLAAAVSYGDLIALQSSGDRDREPRFLCAEHGGPEKDGEPFELTGRTGVSVWESWQVARGTPG
jgi:hypothetical protein